MVIHPHDIIVSDTVYHKHYLYCDMLHYMILLTAVFVSCL